MSILGFKNIKFGEAIGKDLVHHTGRKNFFKAWVDFLLRFSRPKTSQLNLFDTANLRYLYNFPFSSKRNFQMLTYIIWAIQTSNKHEGLQIITSVVKTKRLFPYVKTFDRIAPNIRTRWESLLLWAEAGEKNDYTHKAEFSRARFCAWKTNEAYKFRICISKHTKVRGQPN